MQNSFIKSARIGATLFAINVANINQVSATEMRFYNDAYGRPEGSATRFGDTTYYNDDYGRPVGSSQQFGNQTFYNDAYGRPMGSATDFGGE